MQDFLYALHFLEEYFLSVLRFLAMLLLTYRMPKRFLRKNQLLETENKTGTSKVGAISKAQKAQNLKIVKFWAF